MKVLKHIPFLACGPVVKTFDAAIKKELAMHLDQVENFLKFFAKIFSFYRLSY